MPDPEDLARRYLNLWADYLAALFAEAGAALPPGPRRGADAATATRSVDGAYDATLAKSGPPVGAAPIAGAIGDRGDLVAELARRVADLEQRVAGLEHGREAARPRRRDRRARA